MPDTCTSTNRTDVFWDASVETLPRAELEALQLRLLKDHLDFAFRNSGYYRQSFADNGVSPRDLDSLHDLDKFPFINKQTLRERQTAHPLLGDITAVAEREVVYVSASSGSTGVPTLSPFTGKDFDDWQDLQARLFYQAGMRDHDRYLHALNFSLFVGGPDVIGAQRLGALCIWAGTVPAERLLFFAKELQPTVTWTTPSYAWYLGETALTEGMDPARDLAIRRIIVAGEPGGSIPETRRAIENLWNAELYDFYGISDIFGACAGMCSEREGLHIAEDHMLVEVLDPVSGKPCAHGEKGELVLTTLQKRARPMIRFRTGDIVTRDAAPCFCGRTHARIWIHGRTDDMFIINGVNLFPSDVEVAVRSIPEATGEYRIILTREQHLTRFHLEIEQRKGTATSNQALAEQVRLLLRNRHGIAPHTVKVLDDGALPRAVHKAKRVLDNR
ncbi:phenylacetate--CoA ligase family protein [Trichlorobacter ammonificans]|uniref:Phenylacetate--coenzyme A ligase n=1 Tax=Trichlorobacter ammonificans TaxID=2916410 RepID=A0ABM9D9T1_9BACT|nr:AMP-binding protein [Trichlorobacter ammonificans]CAH2031979.1 Phenylacetate--coenzyme A ligase [Trichlorobacter ammonificans]